MIETKGAYVQTNGLRPSDWLLTRLDLVSSVGIRFRSVANWAIANRQMRWLMEKMFGIAQGRKLPRLARHSFLQWAARRRLTRPAKHRGAKVIYFVDTYANYFDPQLAMALVSVLEHNGVAVYVHPHQQQAAMPMIAYGALDKARRVAAKNVALLAEAARHGYTILATEPSAVLCLTHEYQMLLDDDDVQLVAENTREACQFLWQMHHDGKLQLDFNPQNLSLVYHMPCHLKALEIGAPGENLLRLVPGVRIDRIERGCSGMAGTYGLKRENYRNSLRAGWGLISAMREREFHAGVTECSTCKMQMEQGVSKPTNPPDQAPRLGIWIDAGSGRTTQYPNRRVDRHMIVQVKLFAAAKQAVGQQAIDLELAEPATIADLRNKLADSYPEMAELLARAVFSINAEYVRNEEIIPPGAEIACIPPVSGG